MPRLFKLMCIALLGMACATTPEGRRQLFIVSEERAVKSGDAVFKRIQRRYEVSNDQEATTFVRCVVNAMVQASSSVNDWEILLIKSEEANAFAVPGGKIVVHSGLLRAALTADQLAIVIGHEMAHVLSHHGREKLSQQFAVDSLEAVSMLAARSSSLASDSVRGLASGLQLGILYPFNKLQENEADVLGMKLAATAGFDPEQGLLFWQNMDVLGLNSQSALSSHADSEARAETLKRHLEAIKPLRKNRNPPKCERNSA